MLQADHIIPRVQGGADELANLQTLCGDCNEGKSARLPLAQDLRQSPVMPDLMRKWTAAKRRYAARKATVTEKVHETN